MLLYGICCLWRCARCEVAFAGSDVEARIKGLEVECAESSVLFEVGWAIDERVLAAQFFLDVVEPGGYVLDFDWEEGLAASGFGDGFEDVVTLVFAGADVRADGVDDGLGALTHLDGVGLLGAGVIVVAVGDEDEGAADGSVLLEGEHLVAAGLVERVVERGASAGTELADALVEEIDVIGEALRDVSFDVEAFDEGAVIAVHDLEEELDGGVLLKLEALTDGTGGVEHDADTEGQVGLLLESEDGFGRKLIVEKAEVLALQAGDEAALLVGDGEDEVDLVDLHLDGGDSFVGTLRCGLLGCGYRWRGWLRTGDRGRRRCCGLRGRRWGCRLGCYRGRGRGWQLRLGVKKLS